ncbi:hypothetical protein [Streptomyces sp. NPDC048191]
MLQYEAEAWRAEHAAAFAESLASSIRRLPDGGRVSDRTHTLRQLHPLG